MSYKIGLLTIATGKYKQLVSPFYESVDQFFFKSHYVEKFLFTDAHDACELAVDKLTLCPISHLPWPLIPLLQFHFITQYSHLLRQVDYLFYCDVDMRFVAECGEEMLPDMPTGLVGVEHPGFCALPRPDTPADVWLAEQGLPHNTVIKRRQGGFEANPHSTAYIALPEDKIYFCGAVMGGTAEAFLQMAESLVSNVNADLRKNHIAVWHDESHLNRYFMEHPPKQLSPSYCYPEQRNLPFPKRILALNKNHKKIRAW